MIIKSNKYRRVKDNQAGSITLASGDSLTIPTGATLTLTGATLSNSGILGLDFTQGRVFDAPQTNLPNTAANDDMGLVGTGLSVAQTLQGVDFGGTSTDEKAGFVVVLPSWYVPASTITVRLHAGMLTSVADTSSTVDVLAFADAGDGTIGSDICATAAQSINSLTLADKDFTITPTSLVAGQRIFLEFAFIGSDVANAAVLIPTIVAASVRLGF